MKKYSAFIVLALLILVLSACSNPYTDQLTGTWYEEHGLSTLEFLGEGQCEFVFATEFSFSSHSVRCELDDERVKLYPEDSEEVIGFRIIADDADQIETLQLHFNSYDKLDFSRETIELATETEMVQNLIADAGNSLNKLADAQIEYNHISNTIDILVEIFFE